ncbi:MAG: CHAT domain-containing protein [Bacteroidota bacterium]
MSKSYLFELYGTLSKIDTPEQEGGLEVVYNLQLERSIDSSKELVELGDDKVIELEFEDGGTWFMAPEDFNELVRLDQGNRSIAANGIPTIPMRISGENQNRGWGEVLLKVIRIFAPVTTGFIAEEFARYRDEKVIPNEGLFQVNSDFTLSPIVPKEYFSPATEDQDPVLLLIHGTFSSTEGSFIDLKGSTTWSTLYEKYAGRVVALEHYTLSKSPLENLLDLLPSLPQHLPVHLVTYSRGGIIGDLLARTAEGEFSPDEIEFLAGTSFAKQVAVINKINDLLPKHQVRVQKYVRIAAPAQGTTLMSDRLDLVLNIIHTLSKQIPSAVGRIIVDAVGELARAFIKQRVQPDVVPGLAAMVPSSPFQQMLNSSFQPLSSELNIIAGDADSGGLSWKGLKQSILVLLADTFYLEANDLVVNTGSMYGGFARTKPPYVKRFSGDRVHHFSYFREAGSQEAILEGLVSSTGFPSRGFSMVPQQSEEDRGSLGKLEYGDLPPEPITGKKPLVVLLPGIMGSNLKMNDQKIWLNYGRIFTGSITRLNIDNNGIKASSLVATSYRDVVDFLKKKGYEVLIFPFDWRQTTKGAAKYLDQEIRQILDSDSIPTPPSIQIVAHSMGGLVARALALYHKATWKKLQLLPGFRTILLGTPWRGSYLIPQTLTGHGDTIRSIQSFSATKTMKELLQVFNKFPGLFELLPIEGHDFSSIKLWQKLAKIHPEQTWEVPTEELLQQFKAYQSEITEKLKTFDYSDFIYVAGQDAETTDNIQLIHGRFLWKEEFPTTKNNSALAKEIDALKKEGKQLRLGYTHTPKGDGSVSWELGIPQKDGKPIDQVYYQPTAHGDLARDQDYFHALLDLLKKGETSKLSKTQPAVEETAMRSIGTRGDILLGKACTPTHLPTTQAGLIARFMGRKVTPLFEKTERPKVTIDVSLKMGHLKYAKHPVMVGHFQGEELLGVERILDSMLHQELREQMQLGIYPGRQNTSLVLLANSADDSRVIETIIVGMGLPENLMPLRLARCIEHACLDYAKKSASEGQTKHQSLGISPLLIGSAYGGLSLSGCVNAVLEGVVAANEKLSALNVEREEQEQYLNRPFEEKKPPIPLIKEIEFIEIYRPKALKTFNILYRIERENNVYQIRFNRNINVVEGSRDILPIANENSWWMRLNIQKADEEPCPGEVSKGPSYTYIASTGRARISTRKNFINHHVIQKMLEESAFEQKWNRNISRTLFDFLIPNEFKLSFESQQNIMLVLDDETAAIPWELLHFDEESGVPLCVRTGFIRQLATENPPPVLQPQVQSTALIIGDPELNNTFSQLPAAEEEAQQIDTLLKEEGFSTTLLLQSGPIDILTKFSRNYNVLHVASHGVVNHPGAGGVEESGILLGDNIIITPEMVKAKTSVPELVFLNCCHLGKISPEDEKYFRSQNRLAANLGAAFIRAGAKAVIVAGWAVNDQAAKVFAKHFYERMLTPNVTFGTAVKDARNYCYQRYRNTHTWGAYQCYGDQAYRLPTSPKKKKGEKKVKEFLLPQEAIITLEEILDKTKSARLRGVDFMKKLEEIMRAVSIQEFDKSHPRIIELAAGICAELGKYEEAAKYYLQLKEAKKGHWFVRSFEQYFNIQMSAYMQLVNAAESDRSAIKKLYTSMSKLKENFDLLCKADLLDANQERYNLMGSANKRCYMAATGKKAQTHIGQAEKAYREALKLSKKHKDDKPHFHPLCNWLPIAFVATKSKEEDQDPIKEILGDQEPLKYVQDYHNAAKEKPIARTEFWDEVKQVNILTTLIFLWKGPEDQLAKYEKQVKKRYLRAWRKGGSVKNRESEAFQMQFLAKLVGAVPKDKDALKGDKKKCFERLNLFFLKLDKN